MPPVQGSSQPTLDPYAFLNETKRPPTSRLFGLFSGLSFRGRIIAILGGAIILIIVLLGLKSIFVGNHGLNMPSMYSVLGEQQELINLSTTGSEQTNSSPSYLNFSATALASATTDQVRLIKLLSYNSIKVSPKSYILQPTADAQLTQAEQVSNFDPVYASVMQMQLKLYQSDLNSAYNLNKSAALKSYLKTDYENATLLLKMLGSSYG